MTGLPPWEAEMAKVRRLEAEETEPEPIRLFVSFAYMSDTRAVCGLAPALFGNCVLDIAFEPFTPEHIESLQHTIEQETGRAGVILRHWQRIEAR